MSEPTKFKHLLHAKAFIARGLELRIITEDQVDRVMECKIRITHELGFSPITAEFEWLDTLGVGK